jgi:hypothetical protein
MATPSIQKLPLVIILYLLITIFSLTSYSQGSGYSLDFDGSNDYVNMGSISQLNITSNITIEAWVLNQSAPSNYAGIISNLSDNYADENGYGLFYSSGNLTFWLQTVGGNANDYTSYPKYSLDLNKWYHIAGTYDGSTMKLYINGVLVDTKAKTGAIKYTTTPLSFRLGTYYDSNEDIYSNGKYDEIRIWNFARSESEIRTTMCQQLNGNESGLIANWRFDDSSGMTLLDQTANNIDGTLVNLDPATDWITSSAPIGDASSYNYPSSAIWAGQNVSLSSSLRGALEVNTISGTPDGIHLYRIDQTPNTITGIDNTIGSNDIYYGVFITGGTSPSYTFKYDYTTYSAAENNEPNYNYIYNRTNNSISSWAGTSSTTDIVNNTHTKTGNLGNHQEYLLGGDTYITWDGVSFKNGSGINNAPDNTDGKRKFVVSGTNGVLSASASVNEMEVTSSGILTISIGKTLTVNSNILNNGAVNIDENSSLIQTKSGTDSNSGSGTYNVKRSGNNSSYIYNIWASPIQNATLTSIFSGANPCDIWAFDRNSQTWSHDFSAGYSTTCNGNSVTFSASDVISGGDGIMDVTGGYFVPGNSTALKTYNGTINNGDLLKAISTTTLGNPGGTDWADDDWNLLGNPYPSALNATDFWNENAVNNSRITDALYFWDEADTTGGYNQNSDYASWNLSGGVNSGNSAKAPSGNIASGQGFWVVANTSTNVVFNNSMRTSSNSQFFKTGQQINQHNAWVSFTSPSGYQNNILVGYNQSTTDSIDLGYDAHKLVGNTHVRFASYIQTDEYVIQSIAPLNIGDSRIIPLVVLSDEFGIHQFNEYKRESLPNNFKIFLRDKFLGIDHNLANGPYNVELSPNVEYNSRFELVFKYQMQQTGGGSGTKGSGNVTSVNESIDSDFNLNQTPEYLSISHPNGLNGNLTIIDISGKILFQKQNLQGTNNLNIYWNNFSSGSYFITLQNGEQRTFFKQIIK